MAQKVSIIIPNYNGQELLLRNLPNVIKYSTDNEIIVVDDSSTDNSVKIIHKNFKNIKVIRLKKNVGFSGAVNIGIKNSNYNFVVLLNSDVSPRQNYLKIALNHFKNNKSKKLFAVGFLDYSHENEKIILKGRGRAYFKKGFILHAPAKIERGETFWVSGGSGLFDKKKIIELGGFDQIFKPFYWEDIDICFRASRQGYFSIFEPLSIVDHYHELGAIKQQKSEYFIKTVAYKNQFIFFWKNVTDIYMILLHLAWFPYHLFISIIKFDYAFINGLLWAYVKVPNIILNSFNQKQNYKVTEKEILKKYEK